MILVVSGGAVRGSEPDLCVKEESQVEQICP